MKFKTVLLWLIWPFDRALALAAFAAVWVYRRWISPRKGFVCAHGALTQEPSCSAIAAEAFRTTTFTRAIPQIRDQFNRCRSTYVSYRNDLLQSANAHLTKFGAIAAVGMIECCPGCDDGNRKPPPPIREIPAPPRLIAEQEKPPIPQPPPPGAERV